MFLPPVEPRPLTSMLRFEPILSYIGNPKPTVFNCGFSGYPPPEVRIIKDGHVLATSKESLSYSVTVDSVDDFGEYVCTAENEVNVSSENYTFEIISSGTVYVSLKLHFSGSQRGGPWSPGALKISAVEPGARSFY